MKLTSIIKDAFQIKKTPFPMRRAIGAALSASIPVIIGIILGNFQYGLIAGIGGFSYLYVFNEPYKRRAKKVFFVMLGLSAAIGLGILTANSPILFVLLLGLIGGIATFIFGALKIQGPASIFFVIIFAMTSGMDNDTDAALLLMSLVFLGGTVSWIVAMLGWFSDPYEPEKNSIFRLYLALANLLESIGTEKFNEMKENTLLSLQDAETTLASGYISWRSSDYYKRLYVLKETAHVIWGDILELDSKGKRDIRSDMILLLRQIPQHLKGKRNLVISIPADSFSNLSPQEQRLANKIVEAYAVVHEPISTINKEIQLDKQPIKKHFTDAFDKNSIVFLTSIQYAIVLGISASIAFSFEFERSYWIPVTCGSVMLGSTIISTFHRSIQRTVGTIVGIIVAIIILSIGPSPIVIALFIAIFQFLTETFMVRNYAFAVTFITPNAILIAESTSQIQDISYFATARVIDVLIGCIIGIIGVLLIGRKSASSRLPHLMSKTIRSQSQLFYMIFANNLALNRKDYTDIQNKMRTNLTNLRTFYRTAIGEIPRNMDLLSVISPAIFTMEQLGYFLNAATQNIVRITLSKEEIAKFLLIFETMAQSIEQRQLLETFEIPKIPEHTRIQKEINQLQETLILMLE